MNMDESSLISTAVSLPLPSSHFPTLHVSWIQSPESFRDTHLISTILLFSSNSDQVKEYSLSVFIAWNIRQIIFSVGILELL